MLLQRASSPVPQRPARPRPVPDAAPSPWRGRRPRAAALPAGRKTGRRWKEHVARARREAIAAYVSDVARRAGRLAATDVKHNRRDRSYVESPRPGLCSEFPRAECGVIYTCRCQGCKGG